MTFPRATVQDLGLIRPGRTGDGWIAHLNEFIQALDSNQVLSAAAIAGGLYTRTGMTAGRTDTTDTAANMLLQWPQMDIGDSFILSVSVQVAFAITWAAGTGVTLAGRATSAASTLSWVLITRTGAAAFQFKVL